MEKENTGISSHETPHHEYEGDTTINVQGGSQEVTEKPPISRCNCDPTSPKMVCPTRKKYLELIKKRSLTGSLDDDETNDLEILRNFTTDCPSHQKRIAEIRKKDRENTQKRSETPIMFMIKSKMEEENSDDEIEQAVRDMLDDLKPKLIETLRSKCLITQSFKSTESAAIFSHNTKGIMTIQVKLTYHKEGDARQID